MDTINVEDFFKIEMRVGKIKEALDVEASEKLIRLVVDFGELGERVVFSGIKKWYTPEDLIGNSYVFVFNLAPRKMMGEDSCGMIVAAEDEDHENCALLIPDKKMSPGTKVL